MVPKSTFEDYLKGFWKIQAKYTEKFCSHKIENNYHAKKEQH